MKLGAVIAALVAAGFVSGMMVLGWAFWRQVNK